jgi:hypothetical protein
LNCLKLVKKDECTLTGVKLAALTVEAAALEHDEALLHYTPYVTLKEALTVAHIALKALELIVPHTPNVLGDTTTLGLLLTA